MERREDPLIESAIDLAWGLWAELGVSTWAETHREWSVELEPLVVFTALIGSHDPRLIRETVDWCVAHDSFLSMHQLRHVVRTQGWPLEGPIARFGATVGQRSKRTWPGSDDAGPYEITTRGRTRLRDLDRPAALQLRLRALFGVSARAEIVRVLLLDPSREWSVAEVADHVAYTRRQVTNDMEMLTLGGLIRRWDRGRSAAYSLRRPDPIVELVGDRPDIAPRWAPLFRVMTGLLDAVAAVSAGALADPAGELAQRLRLLKPALDEARLQPPAPPSADAYTEDILRWVEELFRTVASGDPSLLRRRGALNR